MPKFTLFLLVFLLQFSAAAAQTTAVTGLNAAAPLSLTQTNKQLDTITAKLNSGKVTKDQTSDLVQNLTQIQNALIQARQGFTAELDSVQKKINALGPAPEKNATEPAAIAKQRKEFTVQADNDKARIAQIDLLTTKIDEINSLILKIRNRQLLDNILVKQSSIIHPQEFWESLTSFAGFVFELFKSPLSWYQNLNPGRQATVNNNILAVITGMLAALIAAYFLRRYINRRFGYQASVERPDYSQKVRAGIWMFIARGVIPAAIISAFLFWLKNNELINKDSFGLLLRTIAIYLLYYYLAKAVVFYAF